MTPTPLSLVMTPEEARRFNTFMEDRERARNRIAMLEREADEFTREGRTVPAAAKLRTARLVRHLWCIEEGTGSTGEL